MSNNIENDRSVTSGKMYPIDLAPQKITIVKSMPNTEVKMAHLIPGQPKTTNSSQIIGHSSMGSIGVMRTATQIITPGVTPQPQIVSGSPIIQGTQIVSQGSNQILGQTSQIVNQSQILSSGQLLSPGTQIISQGTQLSAPVPANNSAQVSNGSSASSTMLNVGGGLVSGSGNLVVSSSVRTLPSSVRVLPPITHHTNRPVLSNINVSNASGVLVSKSVTSHVPRGLAAGASLAVRPVVTAIPSAAQGGWSSRTARGALVYGSRARSPAPRPAAPPPAPQPPQSPHSTGVALPPTTALTWAALPGGTRGAAHPGARSREAPLALVVQDSLDESGRRQRSQRGARPSSVISSTVRSPVPPPASRPMPLLQRNYQPTKVVGVANVGLRGVVGNSAPPQLYYEVPRAPPAGGTGHQPGAPQPAPLHQPLQLPRLLTPYTHALNTPPTQVSAVSAGTTQDARAPAAPPALNATLPPRPTILRKRDVDGSPSKVSSSGITLMANASAGPVYSTGWEDVPTGGRAGVGSGSTTISAASSPTLELEAEAPRHPDLSPRKKPRKQILSSEVRQCEFPPEDKPPTPPPQAPPVPAPKRPTLRSMFVCGWRGTALHFTRPAEVRRREARRDLAAIAQQRHVLTSAEGWKVHHLTAQMDDLVSLEADVGEQLTEVLQSLETSSGRAHASLKPLSHTLLELIKGNIQRSKIVCEGIQEAREDILRVFKHRNFVSDILTRQSEKRCFRKHRSMS